MAMQAQPLLTEEQYKDLIVFQSHQHLEAVKMASQHASQAVHATRTAESLSGQLKEAQEELHTLKNPPLPEIAEPAVPGGVEVLTAPPAPEA